MLLRGGHNTKESTAKRQEKLNSPLELHIFQPISFLRDLIKERLSLVRAYSVGLEEDTRPYFEVEVCWLHKDLGSSYYYDIVIFLVYSFRVKPDTQECRAALSLVK